MADSSPFPDYPALESDRPPLLRLSQGHLNLLATCPRKFQHTFLEQLGSLASPEQQARQTWGSRFHLLMQQRELGLPIEALIQQDEQLRGWLAAFVAAAPELITPSSNHKVPLFRESEHRRTLNHLGYLLTVVYDLLILEEQQAQILDWKTYPRPLNAQWLAENWQTRLYLYVLAETSDYLPEQISMTYWFVQPSEEPAASNPEPQSLQFTYTQAWHERNQQELTQLLSQLTTWLQHYQLGEAFPQVPESSAFCRPCHFSLRCQRSREYQAQQVTHHGLPDLTEIQEISL